MKLRLDHSKVAFVDFRTPEELLFVFWWRLFFSSFWILFILGRKIMVRLIRIWFWVNQSKKIDGLKIFFFTIFGSIFFSIFVSKFGPSNLIFFNFDGPCLRFIFGGERPHAIYVIWSQREVLWEVRLRYEKKNKKKWKIEIEEENGIPKRKEKDL